MVSAVRTQKQQSMCYGPTILPGTYGHYVGGSSKNAPMQPLILLFISVTGGQIGV